VAARAKAVTAAAASAAAAADAAAGGAPAGPPESGMSGEGDAARVADALLEVGVMAPLQEGVTVPACWRAVPGCRGLAMLLNGEEPAAVVVIGSVAAAAAGVVLGAAANVAAAADDCSGAVDADVAAASAGALAVDTAAVVGAKDEKRFVAAPSPRPSKPAAPSCASPALPP